MKFGFVILHYLALDATVSCISSILTFDKNCDIVVVDNASNNGSFEEIKYKFSKHAKIHFLSNLTNLGFAEGNNVGYRYARDVLKDRYIAVINNDIKIEPGGVSKQSEKLFEQYRYSILGPDIVSSKTKIHQNPMSRTVLSRNSVRREILRYQMLLLISRLGLYQLARRFSPNTSVTPRGGADPMFEHLQQGVQLHGAFLIFSPYFVEREEMAFRPGTFLYEEETILHLYCEQRKYITLYDPSITVHHQEDVATESEFQVGKKKREFVFKNMIQSLNVLEKFLDDFDVNNK